MATCPHCKNEILSLDYSARYSETVFGRSSGSCALDGSDTEVMDIESTDSDDFQEDDFEYFCPDCGEQIHDLAQLKKLQENAPGNFPKKRGKKRTT